ncbi:MAG: hypothetical protein E5W90_28615 [Mesorhizobium sp.]|nr:MAG: hypothetical protein E5W90_28615 [Mesorhizobium sp.]
MIAAAPLGDVAFTVGAASHRFVILGRSKERSDAAQTLGSMPGRQRASHRLRHPRAEQGAQRRSADPRIHAVASMPRNGYRILLRCAIRWTSRNGSSGLRDAAARLLRPWMTKSGRLRPIITACANPLKATMSAFDQPANRQVNSACNPGASA